MKLVSQDWFWLVTVQFVIKGEIMNKGFIFSHQLTILGEREIIGFGNKKIQVKEIPREKANKIIIEKHYSKKIYSASYIHLGIFLKRKLVGVLQFGYAMNPVSMGSIVSGTKKNEYLELNRMWFEDNVFKNAKSMAISFSFKYIKKKFPNIKWIQSFADERCKKFGIVYQACNFKYYGEHVSIFWELNGVWYHNSLMTRNPKLSKSAKFLQDNKKEAKKHVLRQFRYLYFLKKKEEQNCLLKQKPFLKYYL